jgi:UDP-N-acetylmuramyl pentapeptide phosphotransferase/UDP-N-acetylglucosamine-1-phosphate transferase
MIISGLYLPLLAIVAAALLSAGINRAILPLLLRHAVAQPNARSSHQIPTPQGAGIAVIAATLVVSGGLIACIGQTNLEIALIFGATIFIAALGFADDIKSIAVLLRLLLQAVPLAAILLAVPETQRIIPVIPLWLERGLMLVALLWFVNLVNFMDGLDWMTVAEVVPVTGALVLLGMAGELSAAITLLAAGLCGAMIGFAPFNRPVARVFLGDVGSLPIGLLLGWCLLQLAYHQQFIAVLLLPLYYLADATVTLLRRIVRREAFWAAHRSHFYQHATDNGFTVLRVVGEVFALNVGLAALAITSTRTGSTALDCVFLIIGCGAVAWLLFRFSRPRLVQGGPPGGA